MICCIRDKQLPTLLGCMGVLLADIIILPCVRDRAAQQAEPVVLAVSSATFQPYTVTA